MTDLSDDASFEVSQALGADCGKSPSGPSLPSGSNAAWSGSPGGGFCKSNAGALPRQARGDGYQPRPFTISPQSAEAGDGSVDCKA